MTTRGRERDAAIDRRTAEICSQIARNKTSLRVVVRALVVEIDDLQLITKDA